MSYPYMPTRWLITTPDLADDPDVFPRLPGQGFVSQKAATWSTLTRTAASGRQVRGSSLSAPIWSFKLGYEVLRDRVGQADLARLYGFFNTRQGRLGSFFYFDPGDNTVTDQAVATGDGQLSTFQLTRTVAAGTPYAFVEPVYVLNGTRDHRRRRRQCGGLDRSLWRGHLRRPAAGGRRHRLVRRLHVLVPLHPGPALPRAAGAEPVEPGRPDLRKPEAVKTASTALQDFLLTARNFVRADLYSFTLNGGEVLRYTSADVAITADGRTFGLGPLCQDAGVKSKRGVSVSTVDITLFADERHTVNGVQFLDFVESLGLDGAAVRIERAFAASWADMITRGPVGTYVRFSGRFAEARSLGQTQVVVTVASWLDLLSVNLPTDLYQTSCLNSLGDARCGADLQAYAASGAVAGPASQTGFARP